MSISAILASKMFRSSPRKDNIRAALADPVNAPLVQQLSEYLDDSAKALNNGTYEDTEGMNVVGDDVDNSRPGTAGGGAGPSGGGGSFGGGAGGDMGDDFEGGEFDENGDPVDSPDGEGGDEGSDDSDAPPADEPEEVESAISIESNPVLASIDIAPVPNELKSALNIREDTAGVERIIIKDIDMSEFWIYYNDKVNLNNVMSPVIEFLNAANYHYLSFNRLARSDNAMVFDILRSCDTDNEVKPVEQEEDKK